MPTLGGLAAVSMLAGAIVGANTQSPGERAARDFTAAWERGDVRSMYRLVTPSARQRFPLDRFRRAYRRAANTATLRAIDVEEVEDAGGGTVTVPVVLDTRIFGSLRGELSVPVSGDRVDWEPRLVFPELRAGERLTRTSVPPVRATLRSRAAGDGSR